MASIDITIRLEESSDYSQIINLTYSVFLEQRDEQFRPEPLLTAVLRNEPEYDAELCLVAKDGVRVIGYALFSPFACVLMGERRRAVYLAPLCVAQSYRSKGVEDRLLAAGHEAARAKGCTMALSQGSATYHAAHGYLPRMYALSGARVHAGPARIAIGGLTESPITQRDLPFVADMWKKMRGSDRLAWYPGDSLSQWFNQSALCRTSVFRHEGRPVGYVKYRAATPCDIAEFLVEPDYAPAVLECIRAGMYDTQAGEFSVAMAARTLRQIFRSCEWIDVADALRAEDSMMLRPLDTRDPMLKTYIELARQNDDNIGVLAFPAPLDIGG